MKKKILSILALTLSCTSFSQTTISVSLRANTNYLTGISNEDFFAGHSGKPFNQREEITLNPQITLERPLSKRIIIQTGLGYNREKYSFHFVYHHNWWGDVDRWLHVSSSYLSIPIKIATPIKLSNSISFLPSIGVENKILLSANSNYSEIIYEEIYLARDTYVRRYSFDIIASLGIRVSLKSSSSFDLSFFARKGMSQTFFGEFGFHNNLKPARPYFLGIAFGYSLPF